MQKLLNLKYLFSSYQPLLTCLYKADTIEERINAFKQITQTDKYHEYDCTKFDYLTAYPSNLRQLNAKQLSQFIQDNNIPHNVRILHALAHIQCNAFISYADNYIRFGTQLKTYSRQFRADMIRIALEQASHFIMLSNRLKELGYSYGSIPVLTQLLRLIKATSSDLIGRISVISLVNESRGISSVKKLICQVEALKDHKSVKIIKKIQQQEIGHYQYGIKWFKIICEMKNISKQQIIQQINNKYHCKLVFPQ